MKRFFSISFFVLLMMLSFTLYSCISGHDGATPLPDTTMDPAELAAFNSFWDIKPEDVAITLDVDSDTDTAVFTRFEATPRRLTGHTVGKPEELFAFAKADGELTNGSLNGLKLNVHGELPVRAAYSAYYMDQHGKVKYDSLSSGGSFELEGGSAASVFGFHIGNYVSSSSEEDIRRCFVIELEYEARTVCYFISESSTTAE